MLKRSRIIVFALATFGWVAGASAFAPAATAPPLLHQMIGKWSVTERMWPAPGAPPLALPAATAERHLVGNMLLEETMVARPGSEAPFTRVASINYNPVTQQYEYVSWDSRAPQMMVEKGPSGDATSKGIARRGPLTLYGGTFVAPQWGTMKNVAFRYRLQLGDLENGRQVVRLYLTPQAKPGAKEFLAFEYHYTMAR